MTAKGGRGSRELKVRVRSGKGRTLAQKTWLERQLNDPYVARAKREGMRSRAAFKLAEIDDRFHLFKPGTKVVDLGAAPGGWSYSAAKRGARVVAVDNGPLKGGALGNPLVDHRHDDAFGFSPGREAVFDWLFSDMLEDPHKVVQSIVRPWLEGGWCRRFVVNLKFGRVDPIALLADLRSATSPFSVHGAGVRIVHLYHDREELTVTGSVKR